MLRSTLINSTHFNPVFVRSLSNTSRNATKRFMQTAPLATNEVTYVPYKVNNQSMSSSSTSNSSHLTQQQDSSAWSRHSLPSTRSFKDILNSSKGKSNNKVTKTTEVKETAAASTQQVSPTTIEQPAPQPKKRVRRVLKPRKALITLSPSAILHLKGLLDQPTPQLIRIGVRNRGCSGLTYDLEYISEPNKFDEIVEQNGVKVVIDSKALFSIVGSEMDWIDDKLSSRFVFKNPNSKGTCGCGESFMV